MIARECDLRMRVVRKALEGIERFGRDCLGSWRTAVVGCTSHAVWVQVRCRRRTDGGKTAGLAGEIVGECSLPSVRRMAVVAAVVSVEHCLEGQGDWSASDCSLAKADH